MFLRDAPVDHALADIQSRIESALSDLLKPGTRAALVDYPNHENAGDHLIFLGQLRCLEKLGVHVAYIGDITRYDRDDLSHFVPDGPILISGGGNFGDRWGEIQAFRERVIAENPDRRIIQLPQSIDFSTQGGLVRAQGVLSAHPDLTILIRDTAGAELAADLFPNNDVRFCPDMAFAAGLMYPTTDLPAPSREVIYLRRSDSETTGAHASFNASTLERDWGLAPVQKLIWWALHVPGALSRRLPPLRRPLYPLQHRLYRRMSELNVRSARRLLAKGQIVATDRLHGAVMGALMGKPVVALDNANGKVLAVFRDYLHEMRSVRLAEDTEAAEQDVVALLN